MINNIISLSELKIGEKAKVISVDLKNKKLKKYILDMGITRGVIIEIKKISPLGDVVDIYVRDYELCLRKDDTKEILVEVLN